MCISTAIVTPAPTSPSCLVMGLVWPRCRVKAKDRRIDSVGEPLQEGSCGLSQHAWICGRYLLLQHLEAADRVPMRGCTGWGQTSSPLPDRRFEVCLRDAAVRRGQVPENPGLPTDVLHLRLPNHRTVTKVRADRNHRHRGDPGQRPHQPIRFAISLGGADRGRPRQRNRTELMKVGSRPRLQHRGHRRAGASGEGAEGALRKVAGQTCLWSAAIARAALLWRMDLNRRGDVPDHRPIPTPSRSRTRTSSCANLQWPG